MPAAKNKHAIVRKDLRDTKRRAGITKYVGKGRYCTKVILQKTEVI